MSDDDPHGAMGGASTSLAGSLDSPAGDGASTCPRAPSARTAAAIVGCGNATAPWPGIAFPMRRATPAPVGGAAAAIMSPTPPRYRPAAPAAPTETPATKTSGGISSKSVDEKLSLLSASSTLVGEGLLKIHGKVLLFGSVAGNVFNWAGMPQIPGVFKAHVIDWVDLSQLPGFFKGLSCVLDGANEVLQGSIQAFAAVRGSSRVFHSICGCIPPASYSVPKAGRSHVPYAGASCPQQGLHTILSCCVIRRSDFDSVLIVEDRGISRKSPKKVLPIVQTIRTKAELTCAIQKFKNGDPVHLIDISENDVSLDLALDFWNLLLEKGATALLKCDSNLCRMSKEAYSLQEEKKELESQLAILKNKVDEIEHSITLASDKLASLKPKLGRRLDLTNVDDCLPSASMTTLVASEDQHNTNLLESKENVFIPAPANTDISDAI